ncbi:MAG: hypothetical protein U9Q34_07900 [Elusimicrobiota bacterium]|nr:hypothetical protein [Elusimicrobiota bacterium]
MKKIILLMGIVIFPFTMINGELLTEPLKDPMKGRAMKIRRPEADRIVLSISTKLRLSTRQEERISKALNKETRKFDKTFDDYQEAEEKEKKWRVEMNDLRYEMLKINMGISDVIRDYLDEEQREAFDTMVEQRMSPKKTRRKKKRVKRKRLKAPKKTRRVRPKKQRKVRTPKPKLLESAPVEDGSDMGYYP